MDGQVKIRGQRIELGEIEHVLRSHKRVSDAVAVLQQSDGDGVRLAGFVIVDEGAAMVNEQVDDGDSNGGDEDESQHVGAWEQQFDDDIYSPINNIQSERIGRDFAGWTSMYDGSEIDEMEMNEWLDDTIYTMLNGSKPGSVLEIGSGTGMVLFNLGDGLQGYVGVDPSRKAIEFVAKTAKSIPALASKVRLHKATAMDIGRLEPSVTANLASLNSVVQYFPSQEYLFKVVQELLQITGIQTIFFGDVRSYALHREFLAARALRMAGDKATMADIRRIMTDMERVEAELLVDPAFFTALPGRLPELVEHVEILPKRMKATNELSCYRYAAVVHVRSRSGPKREIQIVKEDEWINFSERKLDRQSLQQQLRSLSGLSTAAISNIPYSKTIVSRCLVEALDDMGADTRDAPGWLSSVYQQAQHRPSLSATDLVELAQESGCLVEISWNRQHSQRGGLDAIFHRSPPRNGENRRLFRFPTEHTDRPPHTLSSKPLRQRMLKKTQQQLLAMLQAQLPAYMVPQAITVLDAMPVTQNGKVDRKALEQRVQTERSSKAPVQQSLSDGELRMQKLWAGVLGVAANSIGLDDSFFRLGGDSIAAMKLVGKARKAGMQLSVADIFRNPKLVALANLDTGKSNSMAEDILAFSLLGEDVDVAHVREEAAASCGVDVSLVEDMYPCSPLQEGLMSLTSKRAGDYIMQSVLELRVDVDEGAFRVAWERVVRSTAALCTRIVQNNKLGLLQAVIAEDIRWVEAEGLKEYLQTDKSVSMGLGDRLTRYALVKEPQEGKRWFVWTIHHALYDGWSLPRMVDAVTKTYNGGVIEKQPGFHAFIKYLGQQDQEATAKYWLTMLADCEATSFPPLPPAVQQPVADAIVDYQCPPLPRAPSNTTLSTLIRAAWAIVASHHTNSDDVVFGATVTGRNAPVAGIEAMIGSTVATVPVRVRVRGDQAVAAFLQGLQQQSTEMITYEQTGLQRIAKMAAGARHACGFQTLLVVQSAGDAPESNKALGEWRGRSELQDFTTYALMLQCTLAAEGVNITASFDPRAVERWQMEKILGQFSFVMQQLARASREDKLADIDTLTPDDRQELMAWSSAVPPAVEQCVHDLFSDHVKARPEAPAICAWDGEMTYGELDESSTRLAGRLVELGVKPEDIVPLCFEKSMWTIVAMLAVLKAGGAFVPLDPEHPQSRHEEIFKQTGTEVVLTSAQYSTLWAGSARTVVAVGRSSIQHLSNTTNSTYSAVQPSNAAYVIFTSGSTGVAKGVVMEHRAVSAGCLGHGRALGFTLSTRALQFASYTFDVCIAEIVTTLIHGGCVCVPSDSDRRDNLAQAINNLRANWAFLTPSVAQLLHPGKASSLKTLVLGGEQVSFADWKRWDGLVQTMNGYGPAECCVICSTFSDLQGFESGKIGKAVASVAWVVDPNNHDKLAPLGSIGELLVEGPILARGYLNDPEKTAATFINDPVWLLEGGGGHPGRHGRLYKTGDLVRYDADGNLVYIGRKDNQVKVRGQRVELGEVEHHVRECMPAAERVAVEVVLPTGEGASAMLAAFLQLDHLPQLDNEESEAVQTDEAAKAGSIARVIFPASADAKLAEQLPSYMVPQVYFAIDELPTTTSGKMDRRRLREIGALFSAQQLAELRTASEGGGAKQAPSTEAERTIQQLWARVLNIKPGRIGLDDSFFRLGGDSITAMQLSVSARRLHIRLSTRDVFLKKTIRQLARNVDAEEPLTLPTATRDVTDTPFNLSPIQELYLSLESTGKACFDQYFFLRLSDPTQKELLHSAFCTLVDRHSMLRARFCRPNGGAWQQYISDCVDASFAVQYVQSSDPEVITQAIADCRSSLDIENGPVLAAVLCDEGGQQSLFTVAHHLVIDLVSWRVLLEELEELLLNRALPPVSSLSFPTWVMAQTEYITKHVDPDSASHAEEHKNQLSYWDAHPDTVIYGNTVTQQFTLDSWTTSALLGDCNEAYETRPFELMIAALAHSFALAFPDRSPPTIFTETHGREVWDDSIDLMRTVGWFTSMYPVQASRSREDSLLHTICQTKDCARAFKHSGWLYFASQFADQRCADAFKSIFPVEVMFNYSGVYQQLERNESLLKQGAVPGACDPTSMAATPRFSLFEVSCHIENGCAHVTVVSDSTVRYQDRIGDWVRQYKTTLLGMPSLLQGRSPEWTLSDLPLAFTSYQDLDYFCNHTLPGLHIQPEDVEDVYPCSPMQQGILISQSKDANAYRTCLMFEAVSLQDTDVDCSRLQQAWRAVVKRHSLLRTLLVDNVPGSSGTTNIVLRNPEPAISFYRAAESTATIELFRARHIPGPQQASELQHHLSICQLENGRVYLCLDINHAIFDGHAKGVLLRDLQSAYSANLGPHGASFRDVVSYLVQQPQESAFQYWVGYLRGIEPCYFPSMADGEGGTCRDGHVQVQGLDMNDIHAFCQQWELTPATIIQTAWALVLAAYTGSKAPCFGTLSSGRDLPIEKVQEIVCPMINMLVCRLAINEQQTVLSALRSVQEDYSNSLPHQTFPLANVHSALQLGTSPLFNTALSLQRTVAVQEDGAGSIIFREREGLDPTEVSCRALWLLCVSTKTFFSSTISLSALPMIVCRWLSGCNFGLAV
jgi:amino acid adenylation domain-containing protein